MYWDVLVLNIVSDFFEKKNSKMKHFLIWNSFVFRLLLYKL